LDELRSAGQVEDVTDEPPKKTDANPKESAASQRKRRQRSPKRADWPPLVPAFEDVEVVLLAGDVMETLKKPRYKGMFHRAFVGAMGSMGMLQEMGLGKVDSDPFFNKTGETVRIKRPPRLEHPEVFGQKKDESTFAGIMAKGAQVVVETLKYQAHFEGTVRLAFRHRVAQAGHLAGWRIQDEHHAVPQMEHDMKDRRARQLDKHATDFIRFVVPEQ